MTSVSFRHVCWAGILNLSITVKMELPQRFDSVFLKRTDAIADLIRLVKIRSSVRPQNCHMPVYLFFRIRPAITVYIKRVRVTDLRLTSCNQ
jgi:hypothetical protein